MNYSNVKSGIKKLFAAEIVNIFSGLSGAFKDNFLGNVLNFACSWLPLIAFILMLLGLKEAAKDVPDYIRAYRWSIGGLIVSIIVAVLSGIFKQEFVMGLSNEIDAVCSFAAIFIVLTVTSVILLTLGKNDLSIYALKTRKLYVCAFIVSEIFGVIASVLSNGFFKAVTAIIGIIAAVVLLIAQIKYIIFLSKAGKEL